MGDAAGTAQERPFQVTLSRAFYIGVHVVTNAQWARVMGNVPSRWKDADRPVDTVSWEDAEEFCRKLSALPQERAAGRVYRLPTEAEWEYACRAGTTSPYSFGDERILLDDHAWFDGNAGGQTHLVGQKKPNPWGLYDMHGNVWEWCSDWEGDYPLRATTDPAGPVTGAQRIYRGGGWNTPARICRSAFRSGRGPSSRGSNLGFRVAMSVTADEMSGPTR